MMADVFDTMRRRVLYTDSKGHSEVLTIDPLHGPDGWKHAIDMGATTGAAHGFTTLCGQRIVLCARDAERVEWSGEFGNPALRGLFHDRPMCDACLNACVERARAEAEEAAQQR